RADATGLVHGGDGSNALAMAQLSTALTMSVGTATFNDFYGTMISDIGAQARDASQSMERQQTVVNLLENLQQQTSGVSLDEEMTNLIQQQHAYEAAARYVTVMNQVLDSLLNMI
ncbi:MAG TPA: flagellar basal body rod C-terminal domain-containing protein, partial [Methylomirabilota bacterium]|nr:flagellar basal body rod C-terminal domain-containing protein [Methylomirabilota bacterium]